MDPRTTIDAFDAWLVAEGLSLDAVVIGGSALALLGVTARPTRDFDILHPELPNAVARAATAFARARRARGMELEDDWLNNGPRSLAVLLPDGWEARVRPVYAGSVVRLGVLGRPDLLKTKLFALCDRGMDLSDCLALAPSPVELEASLGWVAAQDGNALWPDHVRSTFADLGRRLNHGV